MTWALLGLVGLTSRVRGSRPRRSLVGRTGRRRRSPADPVHRLRRARRPEARARPRAAHRRRRVRVRRHDGPSRRGRLRGALRRVLDRDALAAARLPARHARPRGARGDVRARDPRVAPDGARLRRPHVPGAPAGHPRAPRRAVGGVAPGRRLPAVAPRRPPGPPDDRAGGSAGLQADDDPRLRDPVEQLRLLVRRLCRARAAARRAQGRRGRALRLAAAPPLRERGLHLEPRHASTART